VACGADGFTFSTDPTNFRTLQSLVSSDQVKEFGVYPVLPYAARYVRTINEKGITGLMSDVLSQLSITEKAKLLVRGGISTLTLDPLGAMMAYIDSELSQLSQNVRIRSVILHEVITDLGLSFQTTELFQAFIEHIRNEWHTTPGFATRNFSKFVDLFSQMGQPFSDILVMTPFNPIGFQMNPSRQSCEESLGRMHEGNVIAMSILAGGYLSLDSAIAHLKNLPSLTGVAVGVSSVGHAEETFAKLRELTQ
jgi:hypothetical protein